MDAAREHFGLNALELKLFAIVTMVIDHVAAAGFVGYGTAYTLFRLIGRLAFPIFAFLIAEGAVKTSNIKKYILRLFLFACASEMPYDVLFHYQELEQSLTGFLEWSNQNILFTLTCGLIAIAVYKWTVDTWGRTSFMSLVGILGAILMMMVADLMMFDYGLVGVALVFAMYMWRTENRSKIYPFLLMGIFAFVWMGNGGWIQACAVAAFIPLMFYNGEKGRKVNKYLFYAFYPVHIFVIAALRYLILGIGNYDVL